MVTKEIIYTKENLEKIRQQGFDWWAIHSDEHPSGKRHIGYIDKSIKGGKF